MSRRLRLALSLACAALSVLLAVLYADGARAEAERQRADALARYGGEVTSLVVARDGLERGAVVSEDDVEEREWLADLAPEGALTEAGQVVGRVLSAPVARGAVVTSVDLEAADGALEVPSGHAAVTVAINERLGIPADVAEGARVLAYEVSDGKAKPIADDLEVLRAPSGASSRQASSVVTLSVPASGVERVLSANSSGNLRLALAAKDAPRKVEGKAAKPGSKGSGAGAEDTGKAKTGEKAAGGAGDGPAGR